MKIVIPLVVVLATLSAPAHANVFSDMKYFFKDIGRAYEDAGTVFVDSVKEVNDGFNVVGEGMDEGWAEMWGHDVKADFFKDLKHGFENAGKNIPESFESWGKKILDASSDANKTVTEWFTGKDDVVDARGVPVN